MNAEDWICLSNDRGIQQRIANDPYSKAYPALLTHFNGIKNLDWDAAVLGLHIVYGWMPTIPRLSKIMGWDTAEEQQLVSCLNDARTGQDLDDPSLHNLKSFCNNSIVGGSKFLHFLNPEMFPIWDSRVAKVFLRKPDAQSHKINSIDTWNQYRETLANWGNIPEVRERCAGLKNPGTFLHDVKNLRLIELVMFHKTISKRR